MLEERIIFCVTSATPSGQGALELCSIEQSEMLLAKRGPSLSSVKRCALATRVFHNLHKYTATVFYDIKTRKTSGFKSHSLDRSSSICRCVNIRTRQAKPAVKSASTAC